MQLRNIHKHRIPLAFSLLMFPSAPALANSLNPSTNMYGSLGLNTVPSARMDSQGTIRLGISSLDPYIHSWVSAQIADPLSITIRQSGEISNINEDADRLYPGIDARLRLLKENSSRPEITIGLQSAAGHKRMAGEYIVASKRYNNFDFSAGLGWGRFATAKHFKNPLIGLHEHFRNARSGNDEMPTNAQNWFTGEHIGIFAGIEYATPIEGISIKADYGADRYVAEKSSFNFDTPQPWSIGFNYKPANWIDFGLAAQGTDKIMARLSLQNNIKNWHKAPPLSTNTKIAQNKIGEPNPHKMVLSAQKDNIDIHHIEIKDNTVHAALNLDEQSSTPHQLGVAAVHISNNSGKNIEEISISPHLKGLKGPNFNIIRSNIIKAKSLNNHSTEEIWIKKTVRHESKSKPSVHRSFKKTDFFLNLDNQFSLAEEDQGILYRSSIVAGTHIQRPKSAPSFLSFLDFGGSIRLNVKDNLSKFSKIRPRSALPVRSNEDRFAKRTLSLDTQYISFLHSFKDELHLSLIGGYLEEMYGGFGGEVLFRPYNARWAIGAESWLALKRSPETSWNLGFNGDHLVTSHLNLYYDMPSIDTKLHLQTGRYLAEDIGGKIALSKTFKNGATLEGYVTLTDAADFDLFGGTTHVNHGLKLSLPLGGYKYTPPNTRLNTKTAPFGRDIGQEIKKPFSLYKLTDRFSEKHISDHWADIAP